MNHLIVRKWSNKSDIRRQNVSPCPRGQFTVNYIPVRTGFLVHITICCFDVTDRSFVQEQVTSRSLQVDTNARRFRKRIRQLTSRFLTDAVRPDERRVADPNGENAAGIKSRLNEKGLFTLEK